MALSVTVPEDEENYLESLLKTLKEKLSHVKIRADTLHLIIKYVMELIEDTPIKGIEQKEMALKLIHSLIIDLTENDDEEVLLSLYNSGTIGNMIDLIVDATKGKLNINVALDVGVGCVSNCLPYWHKKKKLLNNK